MTIQRPFLSSAVSLPASGSGPDAPVWRSLQPGLRMVVGLGAVMAAGTLAIQEGQRATAPMTPLPALHAPVSMAPPAPVTVSPPDVPAPPPAAPVPMAAPPRAIVPQATVLPAVPAAPEPVAPRAMDPVLPTPPAAARPPAQVTGPARAEPVPATTVVRVQASLRAGPSDYAPLLRALPRGQSLHVLARAPGGWVRVGDPRPIGWVHSSLLEP